MFQPIKNLFSKWTGKQPPASAPAAPASVPPPQKLAPPAKDSKAAAPAKSAPPKAAPPRAAAPPAPPAASAPVAAAPEAPSGIPEETFALPLRVVLSRLPASLAASVKSTGGGDLQLPLRKVLSQLPQGVVKISFGELRQGAPAGTFLEMASQDSTMIELPLPEIVSRINPALISRRQDQKTIEVPPEVGNVFGPRGETIAPPPPGSVPAAPAPLIPAPAAAPKPPAPVAAPSSPAVPKAPAPVPSISTPAVPRPPAAPVAPSAPALPKAPSLPSIPKPPTPAPNLPKPPSAAPIPIAMPKLPGTSPALPKSEPSTPIAPIGAAATPITTHSTQFFLEKEAATSSGTLSIALSALSGSWPEAVKAEIAQNNLKDSSASLPMANVEAGLKTGKIVFTWREVAGWLHPKPFTTSAAGDTLIELPLKVIAPAFIDQYKPAKTQKKMAVGENIPDIFSGGAPVAKPAAPVAAPVAPVAAPAPAPAVAAPTLPKMPAAPAPASAPAPVAKVPTTLGEVFGEPDKKDWSPRDIVTKASSIKGLAGAVISTHDGLMVAGELPAPMKADTVGAFLPQMLSRMNQFGKELQISGEVSTMTVTFDKVPWQLSKLGKVYFAAMGRPGEPLPTQQLALICGELAKQNK